MPAPRLSLDADPGPAIDRRIFGQFLERATWGGELGPEAAMDPDAARVRPALVDLLRSLDLPVVRFPGGSDVERSDWRDLVDGAHGPGKRPPVQRIKDELATRFGYDEFFRLREELGFESLLVINFRDALLERIPLADAVRHNCGLIAYVAAPQGADLPAGMPDWPSLRAANGHPEPYPLDWLQIGNETWWPHHVAPVLEAIGSRDPADFAAWYEECLAATIATAKRIVPEVPLIVDGWCGMGTETRILRHPDVRPHVAALALHSYSPWAFHELRRGDEPLAVDAIGVEDWWRLLASCPGPCDADGRNLAFADDELALAADLGLPVAVTEWNWNAIAAGGAVPDLDLAPAMLVGAANFLNGLLRRADRVVLGCQSMLMGTSWDINGLRLDPDGRIPPRFSPQFAATTAYARYVGGNLLGCRIEGVGTYPQPYATGNMMARAHDRVAWIDAVATGDEGRTALFLVNRDRGAPARLAVDVAARHPRGGTVVRALHDCSPPGERADHFDALRTRTAEAREGPTFDVEIPPAGVAIVTVAD